jgi:hypothetical protein
METEKKDKDSEKAKAPAERVIVEGEPADAENAEFPARTPRDVAIHKTRDGEDVELEGSKAIYDRPVTLSPRALASSEFIDQAGYKWTRGELVLSKAASLDPDAIRKDGGDPGIHNIPPNRSGERYTVNNPGNMSYSPEGILDADSGEVRERTVEEGGLAETEKPTAELAPVATKLEGKADRKKAPAKGKAKAEKKSAGRGGSSAKAKAGGKPRGGKKK